MERMRIRIGLALVVGLLLCGGCTVIGYVTGSAIDHSSVSGYVPATQGELLGLSRGDRILLVEGREQQRTVTFLGLVLPDESHLLREVTDRKEEAKEVGGLLPGHRVRLAFAKDHTIPGIYIGATERELWYVDPATADLHKCTYDNLKGLQSGPVRTRFFMEAEFELGRLPGLYDVVIIDEGEERRIPMYRCDLFLVPEHPSGARLTGALLGFAVDIVAVVAAFSTMRIR